MPDGVLRRLPIHLRLPGILLDALLPPRCASCGRAGTRWCPICRAAVPRLPAPLCPRCAQPVSAAGRVCAVCRAHPPAFERATAAGIYGGTLRDAIRSLKFRRNVGLAQALAEDLAAAVAAQDWALTHVTAIPLGRARLRQRGFNQAAIVARPLAALLGLAFAPTALVRVRETPPQVGLSLTERRVNVAGAFVARPAIVSGRRVLVVDDVMTTGATLDAAAQALLAAGAQAVFAAALARPLAEHGG